MQEKYIVYRALHYAHFTANMHRGFWNWQKEENQGRAVTMKKAAGYLALFSTIAALSLSGCGTATKQEADSEAKADTYVTLRAITVGTMPENGMDEFYEELDDMTEELGCHLRFDYIPWGDERSQINMAIASGEYDFISNGNFSDYYQQAAKGAFLNLNQYRDLVPDLFSHYEDYRADFLTNLEWNGGLYGIPQFKSDSISDTGGGFFYRSDLLKDWNLPEVTDFESMQNYLYAAKADPRYENASLITDNRVWTALWPIFNKEYQEIESIHTMPYAVVDATDGKTVVSRFETEEFRQILDVVHQWYQDGILNPGILASSDNEGMTALEMLLGDEKPCETNAPIWSVNDTYVPVLYEKHPEWEYGFFDYDLYSGNITKTRSGKELSCISVSAKCQNPEMAVKILEKLHTDQDFYNLISYGVEGIHYQKKDGEISHEEIASKDAFSYWVGSPDHTLELPKYIEYKQWAQVYTDLQKRQQEVEKTAPDNPLIDFTWEDNGLKEIESRLEEVRKDYLLPLCCGVSDDIDADYQTAIDKLYEAGLQEYLNILQQQLDQYWEERS